VSDVDRAKEFYGKLGWRLDADFPFDNGFRVVQFTPPGSGCSIQFGSKITSATPGSAQGIYLIVTDVQRARDELASHGVDVSDVFHPETPGAQFQTDDRSGRVTGPAPDHASYSSFATFSDPDGNGWLLQEVTTRLPGRVDAETGFASAADLSSASWSAVSARTGPASRRRRCCVRVRRRTPRTRRPRRPTSTSMQPSPGATSWFRTIPTPGRSAGWRTMASTCFVAPDGWPAQVSWRSTASAVPPTTSFSRAVRSR
jgi:catechol 2,3-dioxygenase-like lactoylglutathione lyase family enzyme